MKSGKLSWLDQFGDGVGLLAAGRTVVYVDSHDTERDQSGATLTYKKAPVRGLGNASPSPGPTGTPRPVQLRLHQHRRRPARRGPDGDLRAVRCGEVSSGPGGWLCQDRTASTIGMVGFRNAAGGAPVTRWWSNGDNASPSPVTAAVTWWSTGRTPRSPGASTRACRPALLRRRPRHRPRRALHRARP